MIECETFSTYILFCNAALASDPTNAIATLD